MDTHAAFAPAGGIQELSFDEIDEVAGGPWFVPAIPAFLATPAGAATIAAVGAVVTAGIAYVTATSIDDCVTKKWYDQDGNVVKIKTICT
jgi:hypothetical protein